MPLRSKAKAADVPESEIADPFTCGNCGKSVKCWGCSGTGHPRSDPRRSISATDACYACAGSGRVSCARCLAKLFVVEVHPKGRHKQVEPEKRNHWR